MNKQKGHKPRPSTSPGQNTSISFILYNYSEEKRELLEQSVSKINKDVIPRIQIYILPAEPGSDIELTGSSIRTFETGPNLIPALDKNTDAYAFIPIDRLDKNLNFNDFFRGKEITIPGSSTFSSILFKNQPPCGSGSYLLGEEVLRKVQRIKRFKGSDFEKDLLWHLERICTRSTRTIIDHEFPFKKPAAFYKSIKIGTAPIQRWFNWNFGLIFNKEERTADKTAILRTVFTFLSVISFILIPLLSTRVGISGDEEKHHLHAEKVYNYFKTDGVDTLALNDPKYKLNFYSQSFDLAAYVIAKKLNIEKVYELRHFMNGMIGAAAIITTGMLIRFLAGNFAGILVLLFLGFSPRFLGHAMNNPLDIPFAFGYIFTLYHIFRFLKRLPGFSLKHSFWIFFGIAFTTSIRIGGMVLIPYFVMFAGLYVLFMKWPWKLFSGPYFNFVKKGIIFLLVISVAGYFVSLLPWPYALQDPLKNPFNALKMMANITVALRVMFEGKIIWSDALPWYYIPKNMLISIPIVILVTFFIPLLMFFKKKTRDKWFWIFMLYFSVVFPISYIIYKESNVYGGWRHLLFVYPSFVALSALGISWILESVSKPVLKYTFSGLAIIAMLQPAIHIFKNFPVHYVYFNQLVGGVNEAYKKYETDYYLHSLKPGTDWIINNLKPTEGNEKLRVISNAPSQTMRYYYRDNLDWIAYPYTRYYDRGSYDWDYAIFYCNYIDPFQLKRGIWPPKNTVYEVKVDDVVVCAVVERKNLDDFEGIQMMQTGAQQQNMELLLNGIQKLEQAIEYDPNNEIAYLSLARGYIILREFDKARNRINKLLSIYPNYDKALDLLGYSYLSEGDLSKQMILIDQSIVIFNQIIGINYKFVSAFHNLGLAYMMKGDDRQALNYFDQALKLNARYKQSYYMIATIYERNGDKERARQILEYANSL